MNKSLYFSIFGGHLFAVKTEDEAILDAFQIPLTKKPSASCKKCFGRFYTGYDETKRHFIICRSCSIKCIDANKLVKRNARHTSNG